MTIPTQKQQLNQKRNRAKGQISMANGTIKSILDDLSNVIPSDDLQLLMQCRDRLTRILRRWDKHYIAKLGAK